MDVIIKETHMKKLAGLVVVLAACGGGGASKQESFQAFGAATAAMASAQSKAIAAAQAVAPAEQLTLNYSGACPTGGTVAVTGTYSGDGGQAATFDMTTTFDACSDAQGTLDGQLTWTSVADGTKFTATMKGEIDWTGQGASASCDFDLRITVDGQTVTYGGSICGHDMSELNGR